MSNISYDFSDDDDVITYNAIVIPPDYGLVIKDGLFNRLYKPQIDYWNKRLREFSVKNVACYARADEAFNLDDKSFVAIFYEGNTFNLLPSDEDEEILSSYCLELYGEDPDLNTEFAIVAGEIQKLKRERYESQRFLSGFLLFDPPPGSLTEILGDGLGRVCQNVLRERGWNTAMMQWEPHEPMALKTFLEEQQGTITAMQERMLLNMITI